MSATLLSTSQYWELHLSILNSFLLHMIKVFLLNTSSIQMNKHNTYGIKIKSKCSYIHYPSFEVDHYNFFVCPSPTLSLYLFPKSKYYSKYVFIMLFLFQF